MNWLIHIPQGGEPARVTAVRICRGLAWFRVCGWGLWLKWGSGPDLFSTRKHAHYAGPLRCKVLRP